MIDTDSFYISNRCLIDEARRMTLCREPTRADHEWDPDALVRLSADDLEKLVLVLHNEMPHEEALLDKLKRAQRDARKIYEQTTVGASP